MKASPILLVIFNRPDLTASVMETIRCAAPPRLYVAADGPRGVLGEIDRCQQARQIATSVDWHCEVHTLFRDGNLGLRLAVSSALDWFFTREEAGIILEDDCVPHQSFFPYCNELLDYYWHDTRVMAISGDNFQMGESSDSYSYYFSRYFHCWGWATWRRAWALYDRDMGLWPKFRDAGMLRSWCDNEPQFEAVFTSIFDSAATGGLDSTWAFRYLFTCWAQNGLTCIPRVNLVTNFGFRSDGTHAIDPSNPLAGLTAREIEFPLHHPPIVCRAVEADRAVQRTCFGPPPTPKVATRPETVLESENANNRSAAIVQLKEKIRQLEEQFANTKLALDEARRLCHSMRSSLSWRLTWPLRVLRDAIATGLKRAKRGDDLARESLHGPATPKRNLSHPGDPALLVNSFYKAAFGRLAEPEALAHRIHQVQSGITLHALAEEIVASAEFQSRHGLGQKVDAEFLKALYRNGLEREPDPEGLAHWVAEGEKGVPRAKVLAAFAGSDEAIEKVANLCVCSICETALDRNADEVELTNCIKQRQSGSSLEGLAEGNAVARQPLGHVDGVMLQGEVIKLRGWAIAENGDPAAEFLLRFAGHEITKPEMHLTRINRPDVVSVHPYARPDCGFELVFSVRTLFALQKELEAGHVMLGFRANSSASFSLVQGDAITRALRSVISSLPEVPAEPAMPEPIADRLIELMQKANCYLEYGAGGSTAKAVKLEIPTILSVESDALWLEAVRYKIGQFASSSQYHLIHIDIGPTREWGSPASEVGWKSYRHYPLDVWEVCQSKNVAPELILIDGRFRVACFLASVLFGKAGCRVLIDDYLMRPYYADVEQFVVPVRTIDRAAEFVIPHELSRGAVWLALLAAISDPR
jgi:Domain of unknown function (DUF4214)